MVDLELIFLCIIAFATYNVFLWIFFTWTRNIGYDNADDYYTTQQKLRTYKQNMQDAQNTAKQYKSALKSKKKAYKSLQRSYSCLEQENKCLKAKLCEKVKVDYDG